jgi:hypothetical protein
MLQNISGIHAASWQQKLDADFPSFVQELYYRQKIIVAVISFV